MDAVLDQVDLELALENKRLEGRLRALLKTRVLVDWVHEALMVLKRHPENGKLYYDLIFQTYINTEPRTILDIVEDITIPSGKGDVSITLSCNQADIFCEIDEIVSGELDAYDECEPEAIATVFKDHPAMRLSAAIVPLIADTKVVKDTFEWAQFISETGISRKLLNHPVVKLAERLFNRQRVLDYHRIIFDTQYRKQLLSE